MNLKDKKKAMRPTLYWRCDDCEVTWYGLNVCWNCGETVTYKK